ncbi:hypothetical protein M422DRAFT_266836 [Sphaerobolus stellatus SS14]|uniref:ADP,ATP carrier protein n=1 Tax=Sphaerobolus stellatus (strain SS14) TaxID=990650 RepID=A0A0C9UAA4_SPHS4|nr:hypothetical protein M422DRAFT_266836 [Sphaerobolus stellatus SS14]
MRNFDKLRGAPFEISTGIATFLSGGITAFVYWLPAITVDNINNRMMGADLTARGVNFRNTARQIYRTEGVRSFYAGLATCVLWAFPVNVAMLLVKRILRLINAEKARQ